MKKPVKSSIDKAVLNSLKNKLPAKKIAISAENIINYFPEYLYWTDTQGILLGCNDQVVRYLGFKSKKSLIGKTILEIGKLLRWGNNITKKIQKNNETVIKTGMEKTTEEMSISANGEKVVFLSHKAPLRNTKGKIIGMIGTSVNINVLKERYEKLRIIKEKAEQSSKDSFSNLEQIIACMPGSVYWKNKHGVYQGYNDSVPKLLGLSRTEVLGRTDYDFGKRLGWSTEVAESFAKIDQEVVRSGIPRFNVEEAPFKFSDGNLIYQLSNKVPLRNRTGQVVGVVGISIDITKLKTTQALLKKEKTRVEKLSKTKSEFIANMSHDVKTPLSGIIGLSEILADRLKGEDLNLVHDISTSAQQLMNFFNNCLEMAKSEHVDITLIKERFSLKLLIKQITELFHSAIENKHLSFSVDYDPKIPDILLGSQAAIYRILLNLTGNAIKFTHQGGVSIHISLSKKSSEKQATIKLLIQDTGIGIPRNQQKVIFEQFTRLTPSYQGHYEGSGMGLFVVNKLVKSLGGEIFVHSEKGKGSEFTVVLPLEIPLLDKSEYEKDRNSLQLTKISETSTTQLKLFDKASTHSKKILPKILFVEDNPIAQQVATLLLSPLGCEVDIVNSGKKALEIFEPEKYQLVFMDIGLPDLEGYLISKQLRNIEKIYSSDQVPIIGLSAHAANAVKKHCKHAGMQGILSKPLSAEQARQIFDRYIHHQPVEVSGLELLNTDAK